MTNQTAISVLRAYRSAISHERGTGRATEHSYPPAFKALVEALGGNGIIAINDPTHVDAGAPDFIVQRHSVPICHIECKDIGDNLNSNEESEQLQRYRNGVNGGGIVDHVGGYAVEWRCYGVTKIRRHWLVGVGILRVFEYPGRVEDVLEAQLLGFFPGAGRVVAAGVPYFLVLGVEVGMAPLPVQDVQVG